MKKFIFLILFTFALFVFFGNPQEVKACTTSADCPNGETCLSSCTPSGGCNNTCSGTPPDSGGGPFTCYSCASQGFCSVTTSVTGCSPSSNCDGCGGSSTPNDAQYISQICPPATMTPNQTTAVSVTMKNTGTNTWTAADLYRLGSQNPTDNTIWLGTNRVNLGSSVSPNSNYTFNFNATAPNVTNGTYNFQWKMVQDGVAWFGDATQNCSVNVAAPERDAKCVSHTIPTSVTAGTNFTVSVTMKNTGANTWTAADLYRLGSKNPTDNTRWGLGRVNVPSSISFGSTATFTFIETAPAAAGTYPNQWGMLQEGVAWFGETCGPASIIVTAAANSTPTTTPIPTPTTAPGSTPIPISTPTSTPISTPTPTSTSILTPTPLSTPTPTPLPAWLQTSGGDVHSNW